MFLPFKYKWYFYFRVASIIHCELAGLKIIIRKVAGHDDRPKKFSSSVKSRFLTGQKCGKKLFNPCIVTGCKQTSYATDKQRSHANDFVNAKSH